MEFDELISNGQLTKAARVFAHEYYDSFKIEAVHKPLIERLADKCDKYDEAIAHQSVKSEEVAEAIEYFEDTLQFIVGEPQEKDHRLAITALQQYKPWVSVEDEKPESGKHVLLCCEIRPSGKRYVCDGYYAKAKSTTSGYSNDWDCEYDEETDEYYLPEGYYEIIKNWGDYSSIAVEDFVTHWKPLPEPPKGE